MDESMNPRRRFEACYLNRKETIIRRVRRALILFLILTVGSTLLFFILIAILPESMSASLPLTESLAIVHGLTFWAILGTVLFRSYLQWKADSSRLVQFVVECAKCERAIPVDSAWTCPHCLKLNEPVVPEAIDATTRDRIATIRKASFISQCARCLKAPRALECPGCQSPIVLGDDEAGKQSGWARVDTDAQDVPPLPRSETEQMMGKLRKLLGPEVSIREAYDLLLAEFEAMPDDTLRARYVESLGAAFDSLCEKELPL